MTRKGGLDLCKQHAFCKKRFIFVLVLMLVVTSFMPLSMRGAAEQAAVTLLPLHEQYQPGEVITIEGKSTFQTVTLKIIGPDLSNVFYIDVLDVDENHTFQTFIRLPDHIVLGSYTIVVGSNKDVAKATFTVTKKQSESPSPESSPSPSPTPPQVPSPSPEPTHPKTTVPVIEEKTAMLNDGQAIIKTYADQSREVLLEIKSSTVQQALSQGAQTITLDIKNIDLKANDKVDITIPETIAKELVDKKITITLSMPVVRIGIPGEALLAFVDEKGALRVNMRIEKIDVGTVKVAVLEHIQALTLAYTLQGEKTLSKPVALAFDIPEGSYDLRKALVYHKETNGMWKALPHQSRDGRTLKVETNAFGSYAVLIVQKTFSDIQKHWGKDVIEVLASRHILSGVDNDRFQPERNVTRAEFAAMMLRALQLDLEQHPIPFQDVSSTAWYNQVVRTAYHYGLMKGDGTRFRPNDPITREEMAVVLVNITRAFDTKILGQKINTDPSVIKYPSFADSAQISSWAQEAVAQAQAQGWISGIGQNKFAPKQNTKRAEAATVIYKLVVGQ